ncbi:MAG TPA: flagellar biosynthesis protein FlhA [Anaerolineaceae bacterium]|nr:flagellar biosynthesis protein FlhA [Anaerolineaceae bacterium]HPN52817.1 flagellar biosynthesis protein FlhA [Anaerolineaceae bacterium]
MAIRASSPTFDWRALLRSNDALTAIGLMVVVALMLIQLPPGVVDVLIVVNLAFSLGLMLLSMSVSKPLDISVFPSLLLVITLFRLGLNVAVSRLILISGEAGTVVSTFGSLVVGGNYVVGVVVFVMLMVIQFAVITSGAGRVAEVAARFTLDAMPGKQLAIDADLNAGMITEADARARRRAVQVEADFYGAMDGSSKFVRGDAIAAVIVIVVNIVGGFVVGVLQLGMALDQALSTYVLLTVGAGLAIQVPALLVSSAAGLIVTRSTSEASLGSDLIKQLSNFNTLVIATVIMAGLVLVPGLPKLPFILVAGGLGVMTFGVWRSQHKPPPPPEEVAVVAPKMETPEDLMAMVVVEPIELEVGYGLIPLVDEEREDNLLRQITNIRRQVLTEMGFVLPVVRIRDNLRLQPQTYRVKIRGEEVARGELMVDRYLAIASGEVEESIAGISTVEPAFGLPAIWISEIDRGRAELLGYTVVAPMAVLSTHLTEIIRTHSADLLSRQMVMEMLDQLKQRTPAAVDGLIPDLLNLGELQDVLRSLLRERVPIRDLAGVLEVLAKHAPVTRDPNILAEAVRQTMARTLSNMYQEEDGYLYVFTFSPQLEMMLKESLSSAGGSLTFNIDPSIAQMILTATGEKMEDVAQQGHPPILLCPRELRLAFRRLSEQSFPALVVLAFSEISPGTRVKALGMVNLNLPQMQ